MCSFRPRKLQNSGTVLLRTGLCYGSAFDTKYSWTRELAGNKHSFRGYTDTRLFHDSDAGVWRLQLHSDPSVRAVANVSEYPFGAQRWRVFNDACYEEAELEVTLSVNACNESEFNCADGQCVGIEQRCNGKIDCDDKTGLKFEI